MWYRTDCDATRDAFWGALAAALGVHRLQAFGHYKALEGAYLEQVWRGQAPADLRQIPDATLETWAEWQGSSEDPRVNPQGIRADFAREFRGLCAESRTGVLRGSWKRNAAYMKKQVKDAGRDVPAGLELSSDEDRKAVSAREAAGESARDVGGNPHANGNGNRTTPAAAARHGRPAAGRVVAGEPTWLHDDADAERRAVETRAKFDAVAKQLVADEHRDALKTLCRASHDPFAWLCEVDAVLTAMHPLSPHPTAEQVGRALWDMRVNGRPPEVAVFHGYCRGAAQPPKPPKPAQPQPTVAPKPGKPARGGATSAAPSESMPAIRRVS